MIRLLTFILIFTTLSAGTGWALDTHLEALVGHTLSIDAPLDAVDHGLDDGPCDHCCHASAHLMGIPITASNVACLAVALRSQVEPARLLSIRLSPTPPPPLG